MHILVSRRSRIFGIINNIAATILLLPMLIGTWLFFDLWSKHAEQSTIGWTHNNSTIYDNYIAYSSSRYLLSNNTNE